MKGDLAAIVLFLAVVGWGITGWPSTHPLMGLAALGALFTAALLGAPDGDEGAP